MAHHKADVSRAFGYVTAFKKLATLKLPGSEGGS